LDANISEDHAASIMDCMLTTL